MPAVQNERGAGKTFLTIVKNRLVEQVEEGTVGAVSRVNKTGKTVYEKTHDAWGGIVRDWKIEETDFGKVLKVVFDDAILSLSGKMRDEFIKKFAGADKMQPVIISPYPDFVGKDGRPKKSGLSVIQDSQRLYSIFSDYKDGVFIEKNGYPVAPARWDEMTEEQQAIYKIQANAFLEKYVEANPINTIGAGSENAPEIPTIDDAKKQLEEIPW